MNCTSQCIENTKRYEKLLAEWTERWPKHCKNCAGWGGFSSSFDPSPAGVSLSSGTMEDAEPCPECTEKGVCARCGAKGLNPETGEGPCSLCGWDYDDGEPSKPECFCWEGWLKG